MIPERDPVDEFLPIDTGAVALATWARLFERLRAIGLSEPSLRAAAELDAHDKIAELLREPFPFGIEPSIEGPLRDAVLLFLLQRALPRPDVHSLLGALVEPLCDLGVLYGSDGALRATVLIVPVADDLLVTDRLEGQAHPRGVFLPDASSFSVLRAIPRAQRPACRALDLGTGAGLLAIALARAGYRVDALDLNPRAIRIATLNARLAGCGVGFVEADLDAWEPPEPHGYDIVTGVLPFFYSDPRLRTRSPSLDSQSGRALFRSLFRLVHRCLGPAGRAVLWHQVLQDDADRFHRTLADIGVHGLWSWLDTSEMAKGVELGLTVHERLPEGVAGESQRISRSLTGRIDATTIERVRRTATLLREPPERWEGHAIRVHEYIAAAMTLASGEDGSSAGARIRGFRALSVEEQAVLRRIARGREPRPARDLPVVRTLLREGVLYLE